MRFDLECGVEDNIWQVDLRGALQEYESAFKLELLRREANTHALDAQVQCVVRMVRLQVRVIVDRLGLRGLEDVEDIFENMAMLEFHILNSCVWQLIKDEVGPNLFGLLQETKLKGHWCGSEVLNLGGNHA